jgi:hypothetical protein
MNERRDDQREGMLPEHEIDDERSVGGGIMSSGGTAVDRGTGTLAGGPADGDEARRDAASGDPYDETARDRARSGNTDVTDAGRWADDTDPLSSADDEPEEAQPNPYFRA